MMGRRIFFKQGRCIPINTQSKCTVSQQFQNGTESASSDKYIPTPKKQTKKSSAGEIILRLFNITMF
jgi:hypothetical protein